MDSLKPNIKRFCIAVCAAALVFALFCAANPSDDNLSAPGNNIYVSTEADLRAEVANAQDGDVIVVTADITLYSMIYVGSKHITITGDGSGVTLTRGAGFNTSTDSNRGSYNPGMFEVATNVLDPNDTASLTLENITLDDALDPDVLLHFEPFPNDGGTGMSNWADRVYDSVISTYSPNATITLGSGANIINVGGASAVRMTGGVLNLEPGSYVEGSNASHRNSVNKYFGAIWLQGTAVLNFNTAIDNKTFIAPYIHSDYPTTVNFNGSITKCDLAQPLFRNYAGNGYEVHLSPASKINGNTFRSTAFVLGGSNITFGSDGEINDNKLVNAGIFSFSGNNNSVEFNGTIDRNNNVGSNSEAAHLIYVGGSGNTVDISGEIKGNILGSGSTTGSSVMMLR
ncbi:MAG: hypothetical protein LBH69_03840, partial [Methanomassiliicoccaceae archaeon]|nr:hypothetical protein [Methanomassiliicoccaceae archaeon]